MIFIKEKYKCREIELNTTLECLALNVILSPQMNFNVFVLYNPPSHRFYFHDELQDMMKSFDPHIETKLYGD